MSSLVEMKCNGYYKRNACSLIYATCPLLPRESKEKTSSSDVPKRRPVNAFSKYRLIVSRLVHTFILLWLSVIKLAKQSYSSRLRRAKELFQLFQQPRAPPFTLTLTIFLLTQLWLFEDQQRAKPDFWVFLWIQNWSFCHSNWNVCCFDIPFRWHPQWQRVQAAFLKCFPR